MKKKELEQLRQKSVEELVSQSEDMKKQISLDYMKIRVGQEKNLKLVKNAKKNLAQTLTVLSQKQKEGVTK
ncbi:MAG: 50S ribosomal protein L29 [Patescibacteria group bacterium]